MDSKFLSVAPILSCQTPNDFLPPDQLSDFFSQFPPADPTEPFQAPYFDEGVLDTGSRSPFSDYASEDSFIDVMSSMPQVPDQALAHSVRNRKRQKPGSNNLSNNDGCDSDSSTSGSRSPVTDDMSMSPGPSPAQSWDEEEDLRRKRLARKAELARMSRKKKKDRIEELESQLARMQNELRLARSMNVIVKEPTMSEMNINGQPNASDRLSRAMSDFANPNYLGAFYTAFIDKVREDMSQVDQLQNSMQSLCLRFIQWIMNQNDKFYEDPCGLWYSLFSQEVGATPAQLAQLLELRKEMTQKQILSGPDMVSQAFDALRKAMDESSRMMGAFAQIFSPAQLVLFFQWVERFGPVCIKINL